MRNCHAINNGLLIDRILRNLIFEWIISPIKLTPFDVKRKFHLQILQYSEFFVFAKPTFIPWIIYDLAGRR